MAEFTSNSDRGYYIRLWIDQVDRDIANNSSRVRVRLALINGSYTFSSYNCSAFVDLAGQRLNWAGAPSVLSRNSTTWLIDQVITVGHETDGTKTFGLMAGFSGSGGWSPGNLTISTNTFTLTTIPRSSSVSIGQGVIGSPITININRQSSSFKHTIRYHWGSKKGTIATNVDTSTTWTIPLDFANDIPSSTSGTGIIYVDTYSGSTLTGTQSTTLIANVPTNIKPTFTSITLTDHNTAAQALIPGNTFIQIISNIKVTFNGGAGSYGSTITGYKAEILGRNQTTNVNGGTLGVMNYNGTITVRASVYDSRGRWSDAKDVTVTVLEYFAPALSFDIVRTGATSSTLTVTRNARVAPLTVAGAQKNIMTLSFKVARQGTTTYTTDTGPAAGSWTSLSSLTNSQANLSGSYAANQSWIVIGTLADRFTQTEFAINVATESVVFSYDKDNRFAVGKTVNTDLPKGSVESTGGYYLNGDPIQQHKMSEHDGKAIQTFGDWNNYINTGFYYGSNLQNEPTFTNQNGWKYVKVTKHDADWILQEAIDFSGAVSSYRVKIAGNWQPWRRLALDEHPNLVNTSWQSAGYPGSYYKRVGDIIGFNFNFTGNGATMNVGNIPGLSAPQSYMQVVAKWSVAGNENTHVQINQGIGAINFLETHAGMMYAGQLIIMI